MRPTRRSRSPALPWLLALAGLLAALAGAPAPTAGDEPAAEAPGGAAADPAARARALTDLLAQAKARLQDLARRVEQLETAMDREESGALDEAAPRRARPAPVPKAPEPEEPKAAQAEGAPAEEPEGGAEPAAEGEAPAEDEAEAAIREVAGVYDLDVDALLQAGEETLRAQIEQDLPDVPAEVLDQLVAAFREKVRQIAFVLTLEPDLTWHAESRMGEEPDRSSGTWTRDGDAVTLRQTHENDEELDEPLVYDGTWEDGTLHLQPPEDQMPFALVLRKRAS